MRSSFGLNHFPVRESLFAPDYETSGLQSVTAAEVFPIRFAVGWNTGLRLDANAVPVGRVPGGCFAGKLANNVWLGQIATAWELAPNFHLTQNVPANTGVSTRRLSRAGPVASSLLRRRRRINQRPGKHICTLAQTTTYEENRSHHQTLQTRRGQRRPR